MKGQRGLFLQQKCGMACSYDGLAMTTQLQILKHLSVHILTVTIGPIPIDA